MINEGQQGARMKTYKCEVYGQNGEVFEVELPDYTDEHKLVYKQPERPNPEASE